MASITGGWIGRCAEQTYSSPHRRASLACLPLRSGVFTIGRTGAGTGGGEELVFRHFRRTAAQQILNRESESQCERGVGRRTGAGARLGETGAQRRRKEASSCTRGSPTKDTSAGGDQNRRLGQQRIFDFERAESLVAKSGRATLEKIGHRTRIVPFDIEHYNSTACQSYSRYHPTQGLQGCILRVSFCVSHHHIAHDSSGPQYIQ